MQVCCFLINRTLAKCLVSTVFCLKMLSMVGKCNFLWFLSCPPQPSKIYYFPLSVLKVCNWQHSKPRGGIKPVTLCTHFSWKKKGERHGQQNELCFVLFHYLCENCAFVQTRIAHIPLQNSSSTWNVKTKVELKTKDFTSLHFTSPHFTSLYVYSQAVYIYRN